MRSTRIAAILIASAAIGLGLGAACWSANAVPAAQHDDGTAQVSPAAQAGNDGTQVAQGTAPDPAKAGAPSPAASAAPGGDKSSGESSASTSVPTTPSVTAPASGPDASPSAAPAGEKKDDGKKDESKPGEPAKDGSK